MTQSQVVRIKNKEIKLSNLDKVLFKKSKVSKGDTIDYYARIGDVLLPHLKERPLTMKRYPDGPQGQHFYEKQCPKFRPDWFETHAYWSESSKREIDFCVVNDLPSLIWVVNLASFELHVLLAKRRSPQKPTMVMFDLDPGEPAGIVHSCEVALEVKSLLDEHKIASFAKTSGKKGIHLAVPVNTSTDFEKTKEFAKAVSQIIEKDEPKRVTSNMSKAKRKGKVFIDWSQNSSHKTTVCVYSMRATDPPGVSTPVAWEEIEDVVKKKKPSAIQFSPSDVLDRVEKEGDLWKPVLTKKQKLPDFTGELSDK